MYRKFGKIPMEVVYNSPPTSNGSSADKTAHRKALSFASAYRKHGNLARTVRMDNQWRVYGLAKSKGHIKFDDMYKLEYFKRKDNAGREIVMRAPLSDAVMPDGYRTGRFEEYYDHYLHYSKTKR